MKELTEAANKTKLAFDAAHHAWKKHTIRITEAEWKAIITATISDHMMQRQVACLVFWDFVCDSKTCGRNGSFTPWLRDPRPIDKDIAVIDIKNALESVGYPTYLAALRSTSTQQPDRISLSKRVSKQ